ncbi:MAG: altronate dehydratase family protein [Planctomycetota bacterium]|nr:altronate dehydratase family protein [Planctomycetota bacterium]
MTSLIHLHQQDNISIAARDVRQGEAFQLGERSIEVSRDVAIGHKIANQFIESKTPVRKYGQIIGYATQAIEQGDWVHSHNLVNGDIVLDHDKASVNPDIQPANPGATFQGIRRASGRVGTRNYVAVISTVNCSATVSKFVAKHFDRDKLSAYENVDGVIALTHTSGCGMRHQGMKHKMLNRVLGGFARHANVGACLVIGLGCEQATPGLLVTDENLVQIGNANAQKGAVPIFSMQDLGGTKKTVSAAIEQVESLLPIANQVVRTPIPVSELILGTECGGSDGNSGVTANPALGVATDMVVANGGTSILAETSEIYGAEHLLTKRAKSIEVADKLLELIDWWKWYVGIFGEELDNNPSVGNKAGGLTTITEKSLGAIAKAGTSRLEKVYDYAETIDTNGLVIMDSPGYDPPSVTGMVAAGANIVCFTTGRGSCFGCKPVPTIKIASNTPMFVRMEDDMDLNAGTILEGESVESVGERIFTEMLQVASGKKTKSELNGFGDEEFLPWTVGPEL